MKVTISFPILTLSLCLAQSGERVEIERMTHAEIHDAIHKHGKTTVLIYNGGAEQRGPHAVLGGHTFMARRTAEGIARRLGNALVAPVLPFSPAGSHLIYEKRTGSTQITQQIRRVAANGSNDIVLIDDSTTNSGPFVKGWTAD